jgi:hypothetical protein
MTWTRLLVLPPLLSAALVGASGTAAEADDTGHDHSTMSTQTGTTGPHDHDSMEHRTLDMDYSTGAEHPHEHGTETSTDPHEHGTAPPKDRPLGLVLGTFGGVNGAVVLGAALVRRRERSVRREKQARRSQRRAIPAEVAE